MTTVVVIDDEVVVVEWITRIMERYPDKYKIVGTAHNGIRGLAVVRQRKPDIVITDIRIPSMDGLSLIENTMEELPMTAYIVISGYRDFTYAKKALQLRVIDYVDKPITEDKLMAALQDAANNLEERKHFHMPDAGKALEECNAACQKITEELIQGIKSYSGEYMMECVEHALIEMEKMDLKLERFRDECVKNIYVGIETMRERNPQFELRKNIVPYAEIRQLLIKEEVRLYTLLIFQEFKHGIDMIDGISKNKTIKLLLDYIDTHYTEDIGLTDLADSVKMNPAYLSILFKERVGMSYIKYLTKIRIDKAKEYLRNGVKASEVGTLVGYNDYRYFSQVFKKSESITPNEFRSKNLQRE